MRMVAGIWLVCAAALAQSKPDDMRALLEKVLDSPAQLSLKDITLSDLIAVLDQETGVAVRMSATTMALLPHGADTLFTQAEFGQVSLREGLAGLFSGLGMRIEVQRDHVAVVPTSALLRIGRRATWDELDVLREVAMLKPGVSAPDLESLRGKLQFEVNRGDGWNVLSDRLRAVGAAPGDQALDAACGPLGWSWHPEASHIVILPAQAQFQKQLQQIVSIRQQRRPFTEVLDEIGRQSGLTIQVEPGTLNVLSADTRQRFLFGAEGYSAGETLNLLASQARLQYVITESGVLLYDPNSGRQEASPSANSVASAVAKSDDPILGMAPITLSNGQLIHVPIRESDLPPDLRDELLRRKQELLEAIRKELRK